MTMTRDEIMQLDDDALRIAVARALGYEIVEKRKDGVWLAFHELAGYNMRGIEGVPDYPRDIAAAIALLDGMTYPDGVSVEYNIGKETRYSGGNLLPPGCIVYVVTIWGHNPIHCDDYEATADTLPRAACVAWLMWKDGKEVQHDNS